MRHMRLQIASDVVPRCFRSIVPMRETTRVEEGLLRRRSVGTSQRGSCARRREGYVHSISALTAGRLALVGILWTRDLDQHPLIRGSVGLRDLILAESIGR
jgi:hypothetical protein